MSKTPINLDKKIMRAKLGRTRPDTVERADTQIH
jgi:hypothetical protein